MKIYIDKDYKCHATAAEGLRAFDVPFFNGKCEEFIEGCRYVPPSESWTRSDGVTFPGEMIAPWKDSWELDAAQRVYEQQQLADAVAALNELGVYQNG